MTPDKTPSSIAPPTGATGVTARQQDGMTLVPLEPTTEMLDAADKILDADPRFIARAYRAMLAAAPSVHPAAGDSPSALRAVPLSEPCATDPSAPPVRPTPQVAAPSSAMSEDAIYKWWASENGLEDCNMSKLADFHKVVRAVEARASMSVTDREFLEIVLHALMTGMAVSPAINAVRARLAGMSATPQGDKQ